MQVKVFEAEDMSSGLKLVKDTFGPDALILSTKTVKNGKLGLRGKPRLEITAAIDTSWNEKPVSSPVSNSTNNVANKRHPTRHNENEITYEELWKQKAPHNLPPPDTKKSGESAQLKQEINELKNTLNGLTRQVSTIQSNTVTRKPYVEPEFTNTVHALDDSENNEFLRYGFTRETTRLLQQRIGELNGTETITADHDKHAKLRAAVSQMLSTKKILNNKITGQKRISLIGPTGVGKTTTIAKLAANYLNKFRGKIALITIDTYRIAAVEQLKVYGEIMRLPVEVVIKPSDLDKALEKFADYDLILIDTAGRSPRNSHDIKEMADFLRPHHCIDNHLMLSTMTREQEILDIVDSFSILPFDSLIFSKIDECNQLGVILNTHTKIQAPISFLTNGQRVPEDIITPTPTSIADLIVSNQRVVYDG